jgi:ANTAR domain/GAF domain
MPQARGVVVADQGLDPDRIARVQAACAVAGLEPAQSLCSTSAAVVGVAGAGVVLVAGGMTLGNVCASNRMTEAVEEVQNTLGEGPCMDAFHSKAPVLVPDLASPELTRWPGFREGAREAGARAAFGFPMQVGSICIGALNLYHDRTGQLSADQFADAVAVAHVATRTVLGWQSVAEAGSLAWQLEQVPAHRAAIHQATGMVSVQARVSVADALALLRAHAFAHGRSVSDVAADVVAGRLRLET